MKKIDCLLLMAMFVFLPLRAQQLSLPEDTMQLSFLESLTYEHQGMPSVRISQDTAILAMIGQPGVNLPQNIVVVQNRPCLQMTGYRIQVFSSNNQKTAKTEAFRRETAVKQVMPELSSYVMYQAPFWRVRVGDYQTYEDAYSQLVKFRKTFVYGREFSIVRETINLPL